MTVPTFDPGPIYGSGQVEPDKSVHPQMHPPAAVGGDGVPVQEWNPLAKAVPEWHPLKVSGGRARVAYRRWTGRERLAYEDAMTVRFLTPDLKGEDTVLLGSMRLYAVALTVVACDGFPGADGTFLAGTVEDKIDQLLSLDPDTFGEIRETALRVQPLPRADAGLEDQETDDDGDPSPTPPTPADTAQLRDESGSPLA